jgi:hypothetical protein
VTTVELAALSRSELATRLVGRGTAPTIAWWYADHVDDPEVREKVLRVVNVRTAVEVVAGTKEGGEAERAPSWHGRVSRGCPIRGGNARDTLNGEPHTPSVGKH